MELGDAVEKALGVVGINEELVSTWIGRPCGCWERKEKLNQLSVWAKRVLKGKVANAKEYLNRMMLG